MREALAYTVLMILYFAILFLALIVPVYLGELKEEEIEVVYSQYTKQDILEVARTMYGEARGETDEGLTAVAFVIKNRVESYRYQNTVLGVTREPYQFSAWNNNDVNRDKMLEAVLGVDMFLDKAYNIALKVFSGEIHTDPTGGALHYYNPSKINPHWAQGIPSENFTRIGNHLFVRGVK